MSAAVFRIMALALVRDRGALAMSFALPAMFFVVFAEIFSGGSGEEMRLKVAMANEVSDEISVRLIDALEAEPALTPTTAASAEEVRKQVRDGTADVGLIVRAGGEPLGSLTGFGLPPLVIVRDPTRGPTVPMLAGQIQRTYFDALPDVAFRGIVNLLEDQYIELTDDQKAELDLGVAELRDGAGSGTPDSGFGLPNLFDLENISGKGASLNHVAYYAGAVAVLFLLFSSVQGAVSLLEEQEAGILDRLLAGPGSTRVLVNGKFLFLVTQGFLQVGIIFAVAWVGYSVDLPGHLLSWAVITLCASIAAAGLALAVACVCRTRRQAQTLANVGILIVSAVGGSMVPRWLMPEWLQALGWLTPNTWALEAYTSVFWRGDSASALVVPLVVLIAVGGAGLLVAGFSARRWQSI